MGLVLPLDFPSVLSCEVWQLFCFGLDDPPCEVVWELLFKECVSVVGRNYAILGQESWSCWGMEYISVDVFLSFHRAGENGTHKDQLWADELVVLPLDYPSVMSYVIWQLFVFGLDDQPHKGGMGINVQVRCECGLKELCYPWSKFLKPLKYEKCDGAGA